MKYKNILFDLDGTLTDSSEGIIKCVLYAYEKLGIEPPEESVRHTFIGPPLGDSFIKYGVPETDRLKAVATFRERYNAVGKFENKPYPGIAELLTKLKEAGFNLYVATSKPEALAVQILEHFDLAPFFSEIAGASLDTSREKKEDVIRYLLEKIDEKETDTVMIGDTTYDVLGAAEFGIPCIGVTWGFGDEGDMKKAGAVSVVSTMDELFHKLV